MCNIKIIINDIMNYYYYDISSIIIIICVLM